MMNHRFAMILAIPLTLSLFYNWPASAQQPELEGLDLEPLMASSDAAAVITHSVPIELPERRDMTAKHYQIGPHLYQAEISTLPVHYQDDTGTWQKIDLTPSQQADGTVAVTKNVVQLTFPNRLDQQGVAVTTQLRQQTQAAARPASPVRLNEAGKPTFDLSQPPPNLSLPSTSALATTPFHMTWQPQAIVSQVGPRQLSTLAEVAQTSPRIRQQQVGYLSNQAETVFQAHRLGFQTMLRLTTPPQAPAEATTLAYPVKIDSPTPMRIHGNQAVDESGMVLFELPPAYLIDQNGAELPLKPQLQPTDTGVQLQLELPMNWLTDSSRRYPVDLQQTVIMPRTLFSNNNHSIKQAASIWQCLTNSAISGDVLRVGNRSNSNCVRGSERILLQWSLDSLPMNAVVAFPRDTPQAPIYGPTKVRLYHQPIHGVGGGNLPINAHRLLVPWAQDAVSWQNRTLTQTWSIPGGSTDDYLAQPEDRFSVPSTGASGYVDFGSLHSSVGAWNTNRIFYDILTLQLNTFNCFNRDTCYGNGNYGIIYQATQEQPSSDLDRFFAKGLLADTAPQIVVTYFDNVLDLDSVANTTFSVPRAPSPDFFDLNTSSENWSIVAIQAKQNLARADYDLVLSSAGKSITNSLQSIVRVSEQRGTRPDFVVMSPGVTTTLYPWVIQWSGTGPYYIKFINQGVLLTPGTAINLTVNDTSLVSLYEIELTAGQNYSLDVENQIGKADISVAAFPPAIGKASIIGDDLFFADNGTFGEGETASFKAKISGRHAIVVINNGLGDSKNSQVSIKVNRVIESVYLPTILRQPAPTPTPEPSATPLPSVLNGDFESGSLVAWEAENPGAPLLAKTVNNPDSGCFGGSTTAELGTPSGNTQLFNSIPVDREASIRQRINVPTNGDKLTLKYKVFSYDVFKNNKGDEFDFFSLTINGQPHTKVGNPATSLPQQQTLTLWESGCQTATVDMSPYRGQQITVRFAVRNGVYNDRNTWAYVDDVVVSKVGE